MERLYNNIQLPDVWPPKNKETTLDQPLEVPYLSQKPDIIDIRVGRQLFVDDFLIAETDLVRVEGKPETQPQPLLQPETEMELNSGYCTCACPFNGGVFYDPQSAAYKMWYQAGWFDGSAYAESKDGLHWKRLHELDPSCSSDRVLPRVPGQMRDGDAVWLDLQTANEAERYKMLAFYRCFDKDYRYYPFKPKHAHDDPTSVPPKEITMLYASPDGLHWTPKGETGPSGDNTTFFYNPFRKKWIYSMRTFSTLDSRVRVRGYYETDDLFAGKDWKAEDVSFWSRTDIYDRPDPDLGYYTQLYNLDAVGYESVMLGMYSVFMGPPNFVAEKTGLPKINDLKLGFSRDGFHFSRGSYSNFLSSSRQKVSGVVKQDRFKLELLMNQAGIAPGEREVEKKAAACSEAIDGAPAAAIELADGSIVTGKTGPLLGAASSALLNALKRLAGIDQEIDLVSSKAIEPIQQLKTTYLGSKNPRLHTDEILIALSSSAYENPIAAAAMRELPKLRGCDIHTTVILSGVDIDTLKKLGLNLTSTPHYEEEDRMYHKR